MVCIYFLHGVLTTYFPQILADQKPEDQKTSGFSGNRLVKDLQLQNQRHSRVSQVWCACGLRLRVVRLCCSSRGEIVNCACVVVSIVQEFQVADRVLVFPAGYVRRL